MQSEIQNLRPTPAALDKVQRLEHALESVPQVDCPIRHYFAPGLYAREITIEAGVVLTGAVHKVENLVCVSMGRLRIVTDAGTADVQAGETLTCKAGTKNAAVALERTRWTNFFPNPTNERDVDKLVEMLTESKACELLGGRDNRQLLAQAERQKLEA